MEIGDSPFLRWLDERKVLEHEIAQLQATLAQCAGHITLDQMHRLGVSLEDAVRITDRASLEALNRVARNAST